MVSPPRVHTLPPAWRFAVIGVIISLPASLMLSWLYNSDWTIGAGIMSIGAFIAGFLVVIYSSDSTSGVFEGRILRTKSGAAGVYASFVGFAVGTIVELFRFGTTADTMVTWYLPSTALVAFWTFAIGVALCLTFLFGLLFGRIGGWVANTVCYLGSRLTTNADAQ